MEGKHEQLWTPGAYIMACECGAERQASLPRARVIAGGAVQLWRQCLRCGGRIGSGPVSRARAREMSRGRPIEPFDFDLSRRAREAAERKRPSAAPDRTVELASNVLAFRPRPASRHVSIVGPKGELVGSAEIVVFARRGPLSQPH
jgi:hypothetical protein